MSQELERFIVMFDGLVTLSNDWIEATPKDKLEWVPPQGAGVKFGDRLAEVTIKKLYAHITLSEFSWIHALRDCPEGAELTMNKDPDVMARLASDDFLTEAIKIHQQCMDIARGFTDRELTKKVIHTERTYTGMGFLWAMYAHQAYHLGNIDIYLRLASGTAPDFFRFHNLEMA